MINKLLGLPELASEHGALIDNMLELVHWFMAALAIGWGLFFLFCVWRFRRSKNPQASYYGVQSHASHHIEIGVIIVEAILLLGFAYPLWAHRTANYPTGPDVVKVRAVGQQFFWTMHYPGPDGKFGLTDPALIGPSNALGINYDDPNSKDDFLSGELVLAKDRECIIEVTSKDVIHNLHLVPMRAQQDAIPGTVAHMWFKPTKEGSWETVCGQLCGAGHAQMKGVMTVKSAEEFDKWFEESTPKQATAPAELTGDGDKAPEEAASL